MVRKSLFKKHANVSKKSPAWKKNVFDTQVRDRLTMGDANEDDNIEQGRSDDGDLLSRFNDEQTKRNALWIEKD